ncbi:hypothetical protein MMC34_007557 [Xylographa carneopallida]|nr:hypothetical protein [Xylographa carneopallida]
MYCRWSPLCATAVLAVLSSYTAAYALPDILPHQGSSPSSTGNASPSSTSIDTPASTTSSLSLSGLSSTSPPASGITFAASATSSEPLSSFTTSIRPSSSMPLLLNATSPQDPNDDETLPLSPSITPALGVAGVILVLSGTVFTLIGIKNRLIQIFLSVAYLTGLSITVLIVYVMNPPVSNGVEGAYLVAVVIPAIMLGAGALIFKDITEGFGCILGGFCFSMWMLVLKPGGLITSTGGKAIFIGIWCLAFFSSAFSHHTRSYGLIGSTSFSGATAVVLGIDCFSRAGLKEFWLYIWGLSGNLFPLLTATYPITRGMRVETAAIIVLTFIGVMSQLKIWKVIQDRRDKQLMEKQEVERQQEQADEEIGMRLVAGNGREQEEWEATYGDNPRPEQLHKDSGLGTEDNSIRKVSMSPAEAASPRGSQSHVIEMTPLGTSTGAKFDKTNGGPTVSVSVAHDDEGMSYLAPRRLSHEQPRVSSGPSTARNSRLDSIDITRYNAVSEIKDKHHRYSMSGAPDLGPLPFETRTSFKSEDNDASSVATAASSQLPQRRSAQRFSGSSLLRKLSKRSQRHSRQRSTSVEGPSSTSRDETSLISTYNQGRQDGVSSRESRHIRENSIGLSILPEDVFLPESPRSTVASSADHIAQANNTRWSLDETAKRLAAEYAGELGGLSDNGTPNSDEVVEQTKSLLRPLSEVPEETDYNTLSRDPSQISKLSAPQQELEGRLPEATSKVASVHRTTEWAKHLDRADKPEIDRLSLLKGSNSQESDEQEEHAAPVDIHALQQTGTGDSTPLTQQSSEESLSCHPRSPSNISRTFLSEYMASQALSSHPSKSSLARKAVGSLSRHSSHQSDLPPRPASLSALKTRNLRSSSSPIVASPIEEGVETSFPTRYVSSPAASTTLLGKRSTMLRDKYLPPPIPATGLPAPPSDPASLAIYPTPSNPLEDDNMPLAQRRSLLQARTPPHHHQPFHSPHHSATYPLLPAPPSTRRASQLAHFRSSLAADLSAPKQPAHDTELRRAELLAAKHQAKLAEQQAVRRSLEREEAWGQAMRRGEMLDAHRVVMGRMQRGVNERLRSEGV